MKKFLLGFTIIGILIFSAGIVAQSFWGGKTLSENEVRIRWGSDPLDMQKFKDGDEGVRSKMAYSIMRNSDLIGKSTLYIRKNFGKPDGFYFLDSYPAYIIQTGKSRSEDTWQIVFKINSNREVRDVIVHKNCCEN